MGEARRVANGNGHEVAEVALAPKQVALIQYIADGKRNEDIALLMNTSISAVKLQLVRIMDSTGCATRSSLVSWAFRRKLIR